MPKMFISNSILRELLKKATDEERLTLTKILEPHRKKPFNPKKLQKAICQEGGNGLANKFRGQGTGYLDILDDVAKELKIKKIPSYSTTVKYYDKVKSLSYGKKKSKKLSVKYAEKVEEKIILKLLKISYKNMSKKEKVSFNKQINKVTQKFDSNRTTHLTGTAALMALGNLGGFATYTFLTSAISTITMGTLGFGAYTAATSLLSIVLGPIGWAGLGVAAIWEVGKPDYKKLIPIVAVIGAIRQRIKYENETIIISQ